MAILTYPSITPEIQNFGIKYNTQVSTSTINGVNQTVELPGARWLGDCSFRDLTLADAADLKAFLLELRGAAGNFFYGDITHTDPFLAVTGSPTILATSTRRLIKITLTGGEFSPGDYIQIGTGDTRELKMVVFSTDIGGGNFNVIIEPMIRIQTFIG